jgi:putative transcriptional regulator
MPDQDDHRISVHLDELLQARDMTLVDLSARVGVTVANLSILKNGHARAVRFNTLTAICDALGCAHPAGALAGRPPVGAIRYVKQPVWPVICTAVSTRWGRIVVHIPDRLAPAPSTTGLHRFVATCATPSCTVGESVAEVRAASHERPPPGADRHRR